MDIFSQHIYDHPFLILFFSFIIGQCFMPVVLKVARARHFVVKPNKRMSHTGEVPNIGGIDIFMSFILTYLLFEYNQLHYSQFIFIGVFLILMTGFIDDLIDLSPSWKLAGECISGLFLIVLANIRLTHLHGIWGIETIPDWVSYPLSFFVFIIRSFAMKMKPAYRLFTKCSNNRYKRHARKKRLQNKKHDFASAFGVWCAASASHCCNVPLCCSLLSFVDGVLGKCF